MLLLDHYIIRRFFVNFLLLFALLFIFVIAVDLILQLDKFVDVIRNRLAADAGFVEYALQLARIVFDFHGPRIFQFFAYLHGLLAIGAAGFTLAQMHRHKELVAVMASGISLHRVAMPFIAAAFALNLVQLVNQELLLPRLAPLLIRKHGDIGRSGLSAFRVDLTRDGEGALLIAPKFDQPTATLEFPVILRRDQDGRTIERITADSARWDPAFPCNNQTGAWVLVNGRRMYPPKLSAEGDELTASSVESIGCYTTDLTPDVLVMRRHAQYASLLSVSRLNEMLGMRGVVDAAALTRFKYSRFSAVLINLLVLTISLPFFLLREPANLLRQSLLCAAVAVPGLLGALIGMTVPLPRIPAPVGVFLPVFILVFITPFIVSRVKT